MELFDKGLELNSEHVECLYNKGVSLEGLGRASEASEYKERATAIDPNFTGEFQIHSK
jgi:tetratricopeptide (TPR) repeat protein